MSDLYYFDTDAFVKFFTPEIGHDVCIEICNNSDNCIIISEFTILEFYSALAKCKNNHEITKKQYNDFLAYFNSIIIGEDKTGQMRATVRVIPITSDQILNAKNNVYENETLHPGDSIQIAVSLEYRDYEVTMVTGDGKVRRICEKKGINCLNINKCICSCGNEITFERKTEICPSCNVAQTITQEARCDNCGNICDTCNNPRWCERIRRQLFS